MRIGLFGGSFNPPHIGHLILAQSALDTLKLDRVLFIPAFQSPFKPEYDGITPEDRVEMLALAISDHPQFEISLVEIDREGISFTVHTLAALDHERPDSSFSLLMGADAFHEFPQWKNPGEIVRRCRLGIARRPGHRLDLATHAYGEHADLFEMPEIGVSSSEIRERVRSSASVRYLVPWAVKVYIEAKRLYREPETARSA